MSHVSVRSVHSRPLPDISSSSIPQLTALPVQVLRLHLANHHLTTTGTKATMARRLFEAIHSASCATTTSPANQFITFTTTTTPTSERSLGNGPSLSSSLPTLTQPVGITPAQFSTLLQLLSQTLQQNPSALTQQPSIPVAPLPLVQPRSFLLAHLQYFQ